MWAKVESGTITEIINRPKAMTIGDVQYPHNIFNLWTNAELKAINIYPVEIDYSKLKDKEYYTNTGITYTVMATKVKGTYGTATAKNLDDDGLVEGLKTRKKQKVNNQAYSKLQDSDWLVVRAADGGTAIPSAVSTYRTADRTTANEMTTKIDNAAKVDALAALYEYNSESPPTRPLGEWPTEPEE